MSHKRAPHALHQSPLFKLRSRSKLARALALSNSELRRLVVGDELYREFDIPKKSGGTRHVENPARPLKVAQARLARILARISPPDYLFCPVKGRCYVTNAARHVGNRVIRSVDVKKYFPSTSARRVFWFFQKVLQCERDVAGLLTSLCTYQQHLPTGSPVSPVLAFFAHYDVWETIAEYCRRHGLTLTVYIDDCTVSGRRVRDRDMWVIKRIIHGAGLRYHKEKVYIDRPAEVTGVIVRDGTVTVPNRQLLKLKNSSISLTADRANQELLNRTAGLVGQISQIKRVAAAVEIERACPQFTPVPT